MSWQRTTLQRCASVLLLLFVLWVVIGLGASLLGPESYDRLQRVEATPLGHLVRCTVILAAVFHLSDGVVTIVGRRVSFFERHAALPSAVVWFTTLALGIPAVVAALWPAVTGVPR